MGGILKKGMYVRVSVDYEDDNNPRMYATGQIGDIDEFGNINVTFNKDFRSKEEEVIYDYIPDSKIYPENRVQRCKLLKNTKGLYGLFNKFILVKYVGKDEDGYYRYYVQTEDGVEVISENEIIADFTRGEISPIKQMRQYEFQSPFWYGQRLLPGEILNILNNIDINFKTLIGSRAYLLQHQIDTIVRTLKEDKIRLMFADEVGLGKTIEALVVLKGKNIKRALIVVPNTLINQWKSEIYVKLWTESIVYEGGIIPNQCILLVPFESLNEIKLNELSDKFDFCIIDEVHRCLLDDKLFDNLHFLCKEISEVILLSATPIQDRKEEYLKLLKLLKPEIYDSMTDKEFMERYKKSVKIRKIVHGIMRDLDDLDEDLSEEIQEDLEDIYIELEDKGLAKIVDDIEQDSEDFGENKIREALAYISENYQFEKNIIRHRRKEIQNDMPIRKLKLLSYEMKGGDESFYEYNSYEKVIQYAEFLLENSIKKEKIIKYVIRLINSMFSSPWALDSLLSKRYKFINGKKNMAINTIDREIINIIESIDIIDSELVYLKELRKEVSLWMNASEMEIDNIAALLEDPNRLKGRFGFIADYIDQELYDKKIVIFTSYPETLIKLKIILSKVFGEHVVSTFSSLDNRDELESNVLRYQNSLDCKIMICDETGGEGRNFQSADSIIHFDIPFSPTILEQRIGRLDRIGREKDKIVQNIVIVSEDTLEKDLFNLWDNGLNIFTESLSGLEIALDSINSYIINAIINDLRFGLNDILDEIKEDLKEIREIVKEERYYDMSRQVDNRTKEIYENIINKFDSEGGELLAKTMLNWCRAVGFTPKVKGEEAGLIIKFDDSSINYKAMSNTMFDIPDTKKISKRRKSYGIEGTFDRRIAVKKENLAFFAPGEEVFDSIMKNVEEGYRGRCSAIEVYASEVEWEGFIIRWNSEFNVTPLIENGFTLNYKVYSNGHMPLNQIITFVPIDEEDKINKDKQEYILEFIRKNYFKDSTTVHLGKRKGEVLKKFKRKYKTYEWNEIINRVVLESKKDVAKQYNYLIRKKEMIKELSMILAGARASSKYFNNKTINCNEFKKGLEKVRDGILNPDISVDSILYINMKKGFRND